MLILECFLETKLNFGGTEDGVTGGIKYADLEEYKRMVSEGQVDLFSCCFEVQFTGLTLANLY